MKHVKEFHRLYVPLIEDAYTACTTKSSVLEVALCGTRSPYVRNSSGKPLVAWGKGCRQHSTTSGLDAKRAIQVGLKESRDVWNSGGVGWNFRGSTRFGSAVFHVTRGQATTAVVPRRRQQTASGGGSTKWSWLLLLPPALAAYLGKWQLDRREKKVVMLEKREAMLQNEPIDMFEADVKSLKEYERVVMVGTFDEARNQYIGPRPRSHLGVTEAGYFLVTPMTLEPTSHHVSKNTGISFSTLVRTKKSTESTKPVNTQHKRHVMVLRGWVPHHWKAEDETSRPVRLEGVVHYSENPSVFVPKNNPEKGEWHYIDVKALANAMGLPQDTPLIEVITPEEDTRQAPGKSSPTAMDVLGGRASLKAANEQKKSEAYPLAKSIGDLRHFSVMPSDHTNYALTWFTLSAATTGLAYKVIKSGSGVR